MHSPAPDTCLLFLIRHGATESNLASPPVMQGRGIDLPLSAEGRRQAEATAAYLASAPITAIFASPLQRAMETAECIGRRRQLSILPIPELVEVDVGRWEKRNWPEIARNDLEAFRLFELDCSIHPYAGGENMQQVQDRVTPAIARILQQHVGRTVAIVGHNGVNRAYLAGVLGLPTALCRNIIQDNCGINVLQWRSGETKLITCNARQHLEE